ncbi:MAG: DUF503 domain-containing protein [Armatimonadota bacterium]
MIIGTAKLDIYLLSEPDSLKGKRQILNSVKAKVKNKFECLCAEIDCLDLWNKTVMGIVCVSNDRKVANSILSKVIDYMEKFHEVEIQNVDMEFINM